MTIKVIRPGLLTTVQDLGRFGFQKYGVIVSGAMDSFALRTANLLVGNEQEEAALEITLLGPTLKIEADCLLAITGANLSPSINGQPVPLWRPVLVNRGATIDFGRCVDGCRAYMAVSGGFRIKTVMNSRSTYIRAGLGGFHGRALQVGDLLELRPESEVAVTLRQRLTAKLGETWQPFVNKSWGISSDILPRYKANPVVRVLKGEQFDWFTRASIGRFLNDEFQVTTQSDRMGYRLQGPTLTLSEPREMVSEAVYTGTIQVPQEGNPIVLMADCQTTGGYPKIAQVASVDLPVMAQVKPGEKVRFELITLEQAQLEYLAREKNLLHLKQGIALKLR